VLGGQGKIGSAVAYLNFPFLGTRLLVLRLHDEPSSLMSGWRDGPTRRCT
jgi:hypothetical protein